MKRAAWSVMVLALVTACGNGDERPAAAVSTGAGSEVDQAVEIARAIRANRSAAESVLAAHNMTPAGFDSLMYEIASDSTKAAAYARAIQ